MTDFHEGQTQGGTRRGPLTYALWGVALIGAAAAVYVMIHALIKPAGGHDLKALAHGEMAKLEPAATPAPLPDTPLLDAGGKTIHLADLKAPLVVVNLWATWCAPCVHEMPTLARLQAAYPGKVLVAAVSMDKEGDREKARAFIAQYPPLAFYQDTKLALPFAVSPPAEGFPTTIIYDGAGHEKARLSGGADWAGPDARAVFDALLAKP